MRFGSFQQKARVQRADGRALRGEGLGEVVFFGPTDGASMGANVVTEGDPAGWAAIDPTACLVETA